MTDQEFQAMAAQLIQRVHRSGHGMNIYAGHLTCTHCPYETAIDLVRAATYCQEADFTAAAEGLLEKAERLLAGSDTPASTAPEPRR